MFHSPSRRIYLGRLPSSFLQGDVEKHLSSYGTIVECKVMDGYGFVEFLNIQDAEDVVDIFSRQSFLGEHIVIEFAKPPRHTKKLSSPKLLENAKFRRLLISPHPQRYCVWVFNLSEWTRWQDLKDFGRTGGVAVAYSDIDSQDRTLGFIEYLSSDDAKRAVEMLDGTELRGNIVRVQTQQQVPQDQASKRSRSRSPINRRHGLPGENVRRGREDRAWSGRELLDRDGMRYLRRREHSKDSAWSMMHYTTKYY